jgi:hypothetical protein
VADLIAFGMSEAQARAHVAADADERPQHCEVHPENWDTVMMFQRVQTQWMYGSMGHRLGLRYEGIEPIMRAHVKQRERAAMWDRLQFMEAVVLEANMATPDAD